MYAVAMPRLSPGIAGFLALVELVIGALCLAIAVLAIVARPTFVGTPMGLGPSPLESALPMVGVVGVVVGYVWLARVYLRDPVERPTPAGFR
jgi:hypothetical protein